MAGLSRYAVEARGVADEVLELIRAYDGLAEHCARLIERNGIDRVMAMSPEESQEARAFLKKTPRQRDAVDKKLSSPKPEVKNAAILMMIRARVLGVMGADALDMAERLAYLPGASYRDATERAAAAAWGARQGVSLERLFPPQPDDSDW
jgi:hypothetical protein